MVFVLVELGCIECGASKGTEVLGTFSTLESGLAGLNAYLDKENEPRLARGWHPLQIEQRPEIIKDYEWWSPSLVAHVGEANWRLQLHKIDT